MKKNIIEDNLEKNGIEDLVVDNFNVSEHCRNNRLSQEQKIKRNADAKKQAKINNILEIIIVFIVAVMVCIFIYSFAKSESKNFNRAMDYCQSQGHSYNYCEKGL